MPKTRYSIFIYAYNFDIYTQILAAVLVFHRKLIGQKKKESAVKIFKTKKKSILKK